MFIPNKRGTDLETKLLGIRYMCRWKFFYLGLPNSVLNPTFSNVCGLHMGHDQPQSYNLTQSMWTLCDHSSRLNIYIIFEWYMTCACTCEWTTKMKHVTMRLDDCEITMEP